MEAKENSQKQKTNDSILFKMVLKATNGNRNAH